MKVSCPRSEHLGEVWIGHKDQLNFSSFRMLDLLMLDWNSYLVRSGVVSKTR